MEQFHAAPTSQWNVITKMIDECDFYLLVIGGRYGSIDEETGISYTEKEYNYAKTKGLPVLVLIKQSSAIAESEKDTGDGKYDKMKKLDDFRERVKNDKNTVDFFTDINSLKYVASPTFRNAINYVDDNAGWIRYRDIVDVINEDAKGLLESNQFPLKKIPTMFQNMGNQEKDKTVIGQDDVGNISVESAFLLVYAADGDGQRYRYLVHLLRFLYRVSSLWLKTQKENQQGG